MPCAEFLAEAGGEREIVGDFLLLQIVENGKFGGFAGDDAPAQMVELVVEKMVVGTLQEPVGCALRGGVAVTFGGDALAAPPGEAHGAVQRMQHRKRQVDARERHAGGCQPFAKPVDHGFEIGALDRGLHQPVGNPVEKNG